MASIVSCPEHFITHWLVSRWGNQNGNDILKYKEVDVEKYVYVVVRISVDAAENGPLKVCQKLLVN